MKLSKKKLTAFLAGVLGICLIIGTWAYYSSTAVIDNPMDTGKYSNTTIENFPPDPPQLEPGSKVTKKVGVQNTGDYDLVARIWMVEKWTYRGETTPYIQFSSTGKDLNGNTLDTHFNTVARGGTDPNFTYTATQAGTDSEKDGLTAGDQTVVYKNLVLAATGTGWIDGGDGYWYYNDILKPGHSTGWLLDDIVFADNMDMGHYLQKVEYSTVDPESTAFKTAQANYDAALSARDANPTAANQAAFEAAEAALNAQFAWTETKPTDPKTITFNRTLTYLDTANKGYAESDYVLTIITEVCQATREAVEATWTTGTVPTALKNKLG